MKAFLESLFTPRVAYKDPFIAQRARWLLIFIALIFFVVAILAIVQLVGTLSVEVENDSIDFTQGVSVISPLVLLFVFWLVKYQGQYELGAIILIGLNLIANVPIATGSLQDTDMFTLVMPLVSAGMLLGWRSSLATLAITVAMIIPSTLFAPTATTNLEDFLLVSLLLSLITFFLIVFGTNLQSSASRSLNELRSLRDVLGTSLSHELVRDDVELARDVIDMMREQMNIPFARLFMVENGEIIQRIQTGLNRKQMTVDTDFELSRSSGIYEAIRKNDVINLSLQDDDALRSHLLQGTRAAMVVPISFENEVIGVLDLQSEDLYTFSDGDVNVMRFVAKQLGNELGQGKRLTQLRRELNEQALTMQRQDEKLLSFERRERQATTQAWVNYLKQRGMDYMGFDISSVTNEPNPAFALNDDLQPAIQTGEIGIRYEGEQQVLSVPIILRGYTLGAMSFRVPEGSQTIGPRQQELIRSVVQRLGLALENKRLFEQSQAQAQRESKANEVGSLLLSSTDIDTVLRMAAESFNQAMGAVQTQIRLRPESPELNGGEGAS